MSITDWFKEREDRKYTATTGQKADVPEGVWTKCTSCKHIIYEGELTENLRVCRHCGHHFELTAAQRVEMLADEGTFTEFDAGITSLDPLGFDAVKPYTQSVSVAKEKTGLAEAFVVGRAQN
ncbi:MAG: hypothetical protein U1E22_10425 [Coriobacteriia bacterium]|nr:hypothetical protein [Coriobacteriia bacterium]